MHRPRGDGAGGASAEPMRGAVIGGHFAALETPGLLVQDIHAFFAPLKA